MILHTLNASPSSSAFDDCLCLLGPEDALLLMGDAVYAAVTGTPAWERLRASAAEIFVLEKDARAAGITSALPANIVDMDAFVALTERYPRQMAWY